MFCTCIENLENNSEVLNKNGLGTHLVKENIVLQGDKKTVYNLHGQQGDRDHGTEKTGTLFKRSEGFVSFI